MTDKYKHLRDALDAGPTPGPWYHGAKNGTHKYCVYDKVCWTDESGRHGDTPNMVVHVAPDDGKFLEAAYIAAANPETIRALLAERDALRAASQRLADWCEHEVGADPELTPGLAEVRAALAQHQGVDIPSP